MMIDDVIRVAKDLGKRYPTDNFIFGGDFNMVIDDWLDRSPSKYTRHHYNPVLLNFCSVFNLIDVWRTKNPCIQVFTWFKPDGSVKSRLDFWLVSDFGSGLESISTVSAAPLTDHCMVKLILKPAKTFQRPKGYWKFNSNLLNSDIFCKKIIATINNVTGDSNFTTYREKWEFLKYKVRQISISSGKLLSRISSIIRKLEKKNLKLLKK